MIRAATRDDVMSMTGTTFDDNIWALAVERDGELLGIAGIQYSHPRMCFGNIKPELKNYPRELVRLAHRVTDKVADSKVPVYAIANEDEATAPGFLTHVGFEYFMTAPEGEIYKWHQHS
jgi:hypothetical protein